jgi:DNA-binding transcriptional ArsR family regulator
MLMLTDTFAVLAEPTRQQLLAEMRTGPKTVGTLVDAVGLSQPAISKHLRVLRDAGLVTVRPDGQRRWYELDPAPLADVATWLEPYRKLWSRRLDRLERHLNDAPGRPRGSARREG